jgi:hypothetical protein
MVNNLLIVTMVFLLASCNSQENKSKVNIGEQAAVLPISNDWQKDKEGCLKLRNEKLAYWLITENNLRNSNKADFLKVFGAANKIDNINNQEVLIYYFDCVCKNSKLYENGDKCYASFYFEKDTFKIEEFICE